MKMERGILRCQPLQGDAHLLLIRLGFRLNCQGDHRIGKLHAFKGDHRIRGAQGIAGGDILQSDAGGDIPGPQLVHLVAIVGVHQHNAPDALLLALNRVPHRIAFFQHAGVDADKGELAHVGVGHQLEGQGGERLAIVRMALGGCPLLIDAFNSRNIKRGWHQLHHGVKHALYPFVFKCAAAEYGLDLTGHGAGAQAADNLRLLQIAVFQILIH